MNIHQALSLLLIKNVGNKTSIKILNKINWNNHIYTDNDFLNILKASQYEKLDDVRYFLPQAISLIQQYQKIGVKSISFFDTNYPEKLKFIQNPPLILYYLGNLEYFLQATNVAIIGTRKPSKKGIEYAFS